MKPLFKSAVTLSALLALVELCGANLAAAEVTTKRQDAIRNRAKGKNSATAQIPPGGLPSGIDIFGHGGPKPGSQLGGGAVGQPSAKAHPGNAAMGSNTFGESSRILDHIKKKLHVVMKPQTKGSTQRHNSSASDVEIKPCPHGKMSPTDETDPIDGMDAGTEADSDSLPDDSGQVEEEDPLSPVVDTDISPEESVPAFETGSELTLEGQSLGQAKGVVRLRIMGIGLPVDVLGWSDSKAKIHLPKFELTQPTKAKLEVVARMANWFRLLQSS